MPDPFLLVECFDWKYSCYEKKNVHILDRNETCERSLRTVKFFSANSTNARDKGLYVDKSARNNIME